MHKKTCQRVGMFYATTTTQSPPPPPVPPSSPPFPLPRRRGSGGVDVSGALSHGRGATRAWIPSLDDTILTPRSSARDIILSHSPPRAFLPFFKRGTEPTNFVVRRDYWK